MFLGFLKVICYVLKGPASSGRNVEVTPLNRTDYWVRGGESSIDPILGVDIQLCIPKSFRNFREEQAPCRSCKFRVFFDLSAPVSFREKNSGI